MPIHYWLSLRLTKLEYNETWGMFWPRPRPVGPGNADRNHDERIVHFWRLTYIEEEGRGPGETSLGCFYGQMSLR